MILLILIAFSQIISYRQVRIAGPSIGAPVLYWVTDPNPARVEQIQIFKVWLKKNKYPEIDLRVDTANQTKKLIQGVTGVGGDLFDLGGEGINFFKGIGIIDDITDEMRSLGVTEDSCHRPILSDLFYEGRQYGYSCNATANFYIVNVDTLNRYDLPQPAEVNDFHSFEMLGKAFVTRANPPGKRLRYLANQPPIDAIRRSVGVSHLNETMTASGINKPEYVSALKTVRKWIYEDHIIPSQADLESVSVEQGYGGIYPQLFANGNMAMIYTGRYALIQIRAMKKAPRMSGMLAPHGGYPNSIASTRAAVTYRGGRHRELAKYFIGFLASEDYNLQVVRDSDGLPPNPIYTRTEEYMRPTAHTNEWLVHQFNIKAMETFGIANEVSPFMSWSSYTKEVRKYEEGFFSGIFSGEEAAEKIEKIANELIKSYIARDRDVLSRYEHALARQKEINGYKTAGKKIPLRLVDNVFLKRYYKDTGRGE